MKVLEASCQVSSSERGMRLLLHALGASCPVTVVEIHPLTLQHKGADTILSRTLARIAEEQQPTWIEKTYSALRHRFYCWSYGHVGLVSEEPV